MKLRCIVIALLPVLFLASCGGSKENAADPKQDKVADTINQDADEMQDKAGGSIDEDEQASSSQLNENLEIIDGDTIFCSVDIDPATRIVFTEKESVIGQDKVDTLTFYGSPKMLRNGKLQEINNMPEYCGYYGEYYWAKDKTKIVLGLLDCGWVSYGEDEEEWHERNDYYAVDIKENDASWFNWDIELEEE